MRACACAQCRAAGSACGGSNHPAWMGVSYMPWGPLPAFQTVLLVRCLLSTAWFERQRSQTNDMHKPMTSVAAEAAALRAQATPSQRTKGAKLGMHATAFPQPSSSLLTTADSMQTGVEGCRGRTGVMGWGWGGRAWPHS